jgi:hypothetical protein
LTTATETARPAEIKAITIRETSGAKAGRNLGSFINQFYFTVWLLARARGKFPALPAENHSVFSVPARAGLTVFVSGPEQL